MIVFATEPIPHDEAAELIKDKPTVSKEVFDELPTELQARAFTVTGVEDFDVLQSIRDRIAELPEGANWDDVKKDVIKDLSPWMNEVSAEKRAEMLLRHHGFSAYAAAQAREMDALVDIFPYRQYLSTEDAKVRPAHAQVNGIILPADHPFWDNHTPPWDWNCRCDVVELTELDRDEELARDKKKPTDRKRVLQGESLKKLEQEDTLVRGPDNIVDVRTPKQKGGNFELNVRNLTLPYADLKKRWDEDTQKDFEEWAKKTEVNDGENSVLGWLTGKVQPPAEKTIATPRLVETERVKPVSSSLKVNYKRKAHIAMIDEAIVSVDEVHDDGQLSELPIEGSAGKALGSYHFTRTGKGVKIAIKSTGTTPSLTTAHEIGHFLDHQGIGSPGTFESTKPSGILKDVMNAIDGSDSIDTIGKTNGINKGYYLDPREKWARAYAQYIAEKSSSDTLKKELDKSRGQVPWKQWTDEDFEPIAKEIDKAFVKIGWNPKK